MSKSRLHIGCGCGHLKEILESDNTYYVDFKDVSADVCEQCFTDCPSIHDDIDKNPYSTDITSYWSKNTLYEFQREQLKPKKD